MFFIIIANVYININMINFFEEKSGNQCLITFGSGIRQENVLVHDSCAKYFKENIIKVEIDNDKYYDK